MPLKCWSAKHFDPPKIVTLKTFFLPKSFYFPKMFVPINFYHLITLTPKNSWRPQMSKSFSPSKFSNLKKNLISWKPPKNVDTHWKCLNPETTIMYQNMSIIEMLVCKAFWSPKNSDPQNLFPPQKFLLPTNVCPHKLLSFNHFDP